MKKLAVYAVLVLLFFSSQAGAVNTELILVMDGSGRIGNSDWDTMLQGYANAILDNSVVPHDGTVSIGVVQFSNSARTEIDLTNIANEAVANDIAAKILNIGQLNSMTRIELGIGKARAMLSDGFEGNQIIDVSTDGEDNQSEISPPEAAKAAVLSGDADNVNVIGIGSGASYDFNYGPESFNVYASTFDDFEDTLKYKIERELNGSVPAPGSLLLTGLGTGIVGWIRRRRRT